MNITESVKTVLTKYADFTGRARRSEYWWYCLAYGVISSLLSALGQNIKFFSILGGIFALALLVPSIAVGARRLHDIGKSGWWQLISLIPVVGAIILIIWTVKDSAPGENQYGPNPKE